MPKSNWELRPARGNSRAALTSDKDLIAAANLVNDVFIKEEKKEMAAPEKKQMVKVGALWMNTAKSGIKYLSGSLADGTKIIAFINEEVLEDSDSKKPYITIYEKN